MNIPGFYHVGHLGLTIRTTVQSPLHSELPLPITPSFPLNLGAEMEFRLHMEHVDALSVRDVLERIFNALRNRRLFQFPRPMEILNFVPDVRVREALGDLQKDIISQKLWVLL